MYSTLNCTLNSAIQRSYYIRCFSPAANTFDLRCVVDVKKRTLLNLVRVSLIGVDCDSRLCETNCSVYTTRTAICYPPIKTVSGDLKNYYNVAARSSLCKISLVIGTTPFIEKKCFYSAISADNDLLNKVYMSEIFTTDTLCTYAVKRSSSILVRTLSIGHHQTIELKCVCACEVHFDQKCCITTIMKTTTVSCSVSGVVKIDNFSEIKNICYRIAGSTAQVQPLLVIGGFRNYTNLLCCLKTPTPSISDILCCNHGTVDDHPIYTTTRFNDYLSVNIYNLSPYKIQNCELRQVGFNIPAEIISFKDNLWTVKFNLRDVQLQSTHFITLQLKGLDRILILSAIKGVINI